MNEFENASKEIQEIEDSQKFILLTEKTGYLEHLRKKYLLQQKVRCVSYKKQVGTLIFHLHQRKEEGEHSSSEFWKHEVNSAVKP